MYPYTLRTSDPDIQNILKLLSVNRVAKVPSKTTSIKLGMELRDIRDDIYMGSDRKLDRAFIALAPELELCIEEHGTRIDAIFKRLF